LIIFGKDTKPPTLKNQNILLPESLSQEDEIRIVSTARKISNGEIEAAVNLLTDWGFKVSLGKNLFEGDRQFSGTDEQRLYDFQEALDDQNVKMILCARGGYGTVRIIDDIKWDSFKNQPKWIAGYSDITVLHSHLNKVVGSASLHCSMPVNFPTNAKEALDSLKAALTGEELVYEFEPNPLNRFGSCNAEIVGGNLSILYSLSGTVSAIDTKGKILFLEDLDEYLYHIDRMMMNLKRNGVLNDLAGLVVGAMSEMNDNAIPFGKTAEEIIAEAVQEFDYPVCFGFPAGHIKDNRALILGKKAKLTVDESRVSFNQ
jgi:muramoyltetrapeptide carboxypeptidase